MMCYISIYWYNIDYGSLFIFRAVFRLYNLFRGKYCLHLQGCLSKISFIPTRDLYHGLYKASYTVSITPNYCIKLLLTSTASTGVRYIIYIIIIIVPWVYLNLLFNRIDQLSPHLHPVVTNLSIQTTNFGKCANQICVLHSSIKQCIPPPLIRVRRRNFGTRLENVTKPTLWVKERVTTNATCFGCCGDVVWTPVWPYKEQGPALTSTGYINVCWLTRKHCASIREHQTSSCSSWWVWQHLVNCSELRVVGS